MSGWKALLGNVPTTEGNVVALHDPVAPPPALVATWREVIEIRRRMAHKRQIIDATRQAIARAEREIADDVKLLADALERWSIMTAPITEGEGHEGTTHDLD